MKFNKLKPCAGCPFRTNAAPGWLGDYTPQEVIQHLQNEIPFVCHIDVENGPGYSDPEWQEWADKHANHCGGALIMQRKMAKLPRDPDHCAAVRAVDPQTTILFPPQVFIEHHESGPQSRLSKVKGKRSKK